VIKIATLALLGLVCIVLGIHGVSVECERANGDVSCAITEEFAFGLIADQETAQGVTDVGVWTRVDPIGGEIAPGPYSPSTLILKARSGDVPFASPWVGRKSSLDIRPVSESVRLFLARPDQPTLSVKTGDQFGYLAGLGAVLLVLAARRIRGDRR
jgi:hypothetical protein